MTKPASPPDESPEAYAISVAGERLLLHANRGLYWPRKRTLFVADVHLGKAATFRAEGIPLPGGTTKSDLSRLSGLIAISSADRLVVLGDLFHAAAGMDDRTVGRVHSWRRAHRALDVVLIRGNHDLAAGPTPHDLRISDVEPPLREAPFAFVHDPATAAECFKLCGHVHPGIRLHAARWTERHPCFYLRNEALLLPAFSEFTGLSDVSPRPGEQVFAVADEAVVRVV